MSVESVGSSLSTFWGWYILIIIVKFAICRLMKLQAMRTACMFRRFMFRKLLTKHQGLTISRLSSFTFSSPGILQSGGIETITMEQYDRQMNINTRSIFLLMKLALPHILKTKGNIVNISSVTGLRAVSFG